MAFMALSVAQQTANVLSTLKNLLTTTQTTVRRSPEISYSSSATKDEESCTTGIKCERWKRYAANLAERLSLSPKDAKEVKMLEDIMVEGGSQLKSYENLDQHASKIAYKHCRIAVVKKYGTMHCAYLAVSTSKVLAPEKVTYTMSKKFLFWETDSYEETVYVPREITQKRIDEVTEDCRRKIEAKKIEAKKMEQCEAIIAKFVEQATTYHTAPRSWINIVHNPYGGALDLAEEAKFLKLPAIAMEVLRMPISEKIRCVVVGPDRRFIVLYENGNTRIAKDGGVFHGANWEQIKQITYYNLPKQFHKLWKEL